MVNKIKILKFLNKDYIEAREYFIATWYRASGVLFGTQYTGEMTYITFVPGKWVKTDTKTKEKLILYFKMIKEA